MPRVALFVTCLVDRFFPHVGEAAVRVLRRVGVSPEFPDAQTCCGQPMYNTGYAAEAKEVAKHHLGVFEGYDHIVCPSGSCTSMTKIFTPDLFRDEPEWAERARRVAARTYELSDYLVTVLGREDVGAKFPAKVTYHDACHALRELRVREGPRRLLRAVKGLNFIELDGADECCGFGGTFSVKMADLSTAILEKKMRKIAASGAEVLTAVDSSCLMQMAGGLSRAGHKIRPLHLAEILACT